MVGFSGFLRYSELSGFKEHVFDDHVELPVFIESSKTDQFRDCTCVTIAHTGTKSCPVAITECYINLAKITGLPDEHLFTECTKNGMKVHIQGRLTYSHMRELLLEKLAQLGQDPQKYGLHGLRAGGASAAANA